jgi:hypothetical protein
LDCPSPLTDSGYIGGGDHASLVSILEQAHALGPDVTATLPLHPMWLSIDLPRLQTEIDAHGVPVALALEHRTDPFSVRPTMAGLVTLLDRSVPASLLRTDTAALGAIAFGAKWSAIGLRSGLRHFYPITKGGGGNRPSPAALLPAALSMIHLYKIAAGYAATSDDPAWMCDCTVCGNRTMDTLLYRPEQANAHTFELLLNLRDQLVALPTGPLRRQSWRAQCQSALFYFDSLALRGLAWKQTANLRHWQSMI